MNLGILRIFLLRQVSKKTPVEGIYWQKQEN